ncbi:hypothetical protein Emtol_4212 [Emticicia oligotrophica DSM 17448]|uniref:Uncharacterized protein n=1 Tax=Emticicia oligotrophica (strain DSM 17448 / CIP 109782 / MTCC 6937 / GPTSA100-15) TaxID=929562 RepID=A0ABM5N725_EMTOG|nr:hypothetical protein [Emticicia oligotrophica]AFK05336.1 hypothetical protein Emtol_4212 [Emticicia oligotrophica DSM 17448]
MIRSILTFITLTLLPINKWRAGSAYALEGNIYTLSCFVSGPSNEWTYNEKLNIINKLNESTQWITQQANKEGISTQFEGGNFGLKQDIKMDIASGTASGNEAVDLVSKVLQQVGYKNPLVFDSWVKKNTKCTNAHVIIFMKGKGNGYAMPYKDDMDKEKYFVEGAILYEKYLNNSDLASASIAHEILHLYGGWDLYKTFSQTKDREEKAKELFPNSIMLRTSYNIKELEIDEVTKWLIGWNKKPKEWYEWFRPKGE